MTDEESEIRNIPVKITTNLEPPLLEDNVSQIAVTEYEQLANRIQTDFNEGARYN